MRAPIPTYMDAPTAASLTHRFEYCFRGKGGYPPILDQQPDLVPGEQFSVPGRGPTVDIVAIAQVHGRIPSLGFRFGNLAYCNDVNELPEDSFELLEGIEILVIDALRYTPHPSHAHLERSLEWIARIGPQQAWLTNLHVDMDCRTLEGELPDHVRPAYDGLVLPFEHTLR